MTAEEYVRIIEALVQVYGEKEAYRLLAVWRQEERDWKSKIKTK